MKRAMVRSKIVTDDHEPETQKHTAQQQQLLKIPVLVEKYYCNKVVRIEKINSVKQRLQRNGGKKEWFNVTHEALMSKLQFAEQISASPP